MVTSLVVLALLSQTPQTLTPNTLQLPADAPRPAATIQDIGWLEGTWTGTGLGGVTEERWSAPAGGAMMGMFRLVKGDRVIFYEFLTLVEQNGSLVLKLKHFNPDLTGWEEKAESVSFRLVKITPDAVWLDGMTFMREGPDRTRIFLAIRNRSDNSVREEEFIQQRLPAGR
jgi:hypothetical protein